MLYSKSGKRNSNLDKYGGSGYSSINELKKYPFYPGWEK